MTDHSYEEGVRDGRISALEKIQIAHDDRFDHHDRRISVLEKLSYAVIGIIAFIQVIPLFTKLLT